jgi:hypothetical protein
MQGEAWMKKQTTQQDTNLDRDSCDLPYAEMPVRVLQLVRRCATEGVMEIVFVNTLSDYREDNGVCAVLLISTHDDASRSFQEIVPLLPPGMQQQSMVRLMRWNAQTIGLSLTHGSEHYGAIMDEIHAYSAVRAFFLSAPQQVMKDDQEITCVTFSDPVPLSLWPGKPVNRG